MEFFRIGERWLLLFLSLIVLVAVLTRFTALGSVPHGLTWDEAAIGYNGYAIATTRRDEWLERLPISFKSFGDYKAAASIYFVALSTVVFELTAWSVRLPFATLGVGSVIAFYLLALVVLKDQRHRHRYALFLAGLLTLSPWHIHFSRIAFETGISLFFVLVGVTALIWVLQQSADVRPRLWTWLGTVLSAVSFAVALYAYHSAKIVVPLLVITVILLYARDSIRTKIRFILTFLVVLLLVLYPLIRESLYGAAATRAGVLFVFEDISIGEKVRLTAQHYLLHLSPQFMIGGVTETLRHGPGAWSVLLPTTYIFFLIGLLSFVWQFIRHSSKLPTWVWLAVLSTGIGILPAALTREVPHANRALLALPGILFTALYGVKTVYKLLQSPVLRFSVPTQMSIRDAVAGVVITLHIFFFTSFWQYYMTDFAAASAPAFQDGYVEAFSLAKEYEKGSAGRPQVDTILVSSEYGQPYIYALFVKRTNPIWYQGGSLSTYLFVDAVQTSDLSRTNALLIATPKDALPLEQADHLVHGSDGAVRFMLYYTGDHDP